MGAEARAYLTFYWWSAKSASKWNAPHVSHFAQIEQKSKSCEQQWQQWTNETHCRLFTVSTDIQIWLTKFHSFFLHFSISLFSAAICDSCCANVCDKSNRSWGKFAPLSRFRSRLPCTAQVSEMILATFTLALLICNLAAMSMLMARLAKFTVLLLLCACSIRRQTIRCECTETELSVSHFSTPANVVERGGGGGEHSTRLAWAASEWPMWSQLSSWLGSQPTSHGPLARGGQSSLLPLRFLLSWNADADAAAATAVWVPLGGCHCQLQCLALERAFWVYCRHANCIKYCQAIKAYCCSLNMWFAVNAVAAVSCWESERATAEPTKVFFNIHSSWNASALVILPQGFYSLARVNRTIRR